MWRLGIAFVSGASVTDSSPERSSPIFDRTHGPPVTFPQFAHEARKSNMAGMYFAGSENGRKQYLHRSIWLAWLRRSRGSFPGTRKVEHHAYRGPSLPRLVNVSGKD